jgi:hypothetical protein
VLSYKAGVNKAAHRLAKEGVMHGIDRVWFNIIPDFLTFVVTSEMSSLVFFRAFGVLICMFVFMQ